MNVVIIARRKTGRLLVIDNDEQGSENAKNDAFSNQ